MIDLKFVMSFCLRITNAINRINYFRVLIYILNNATIDNLIERFNQRLQKQKKTQFAIVIKLHSIITKNDMLNAVFKKLSSSIFKSNNNSDTKIELSLLHVAAVVQKIFEKFYVCQHKITNKKYILHNLNLTTWMFRVVEFINDSSKVTNAFQHEAFRDYFCQR